jgi:hypothetical protein
MFPRASVKHVLGQIRQASGGTRQDNTRCRRPGALGFRWSTGQMCGAGEHPAVATLVYEFHLKLYTNTLTCDNSGRAVIVAGASAMAALVLLAGCLPGHAELGGDLWPPGAQVYGLVDQRCEFRFGLLLRDSGVPDLLKHPCRSRWRLPLCKGRRLRRAATGCAR